MTSEEQIIEEFSKFEDWMEKYDHLIAIGKSIPKMNVKYRIEDNLIKGCQSQVWLHSEFVDGKMVFTADSDAAITKGMICILLKVFSNCKPEDIINRDIDFIKKIGLFEHISSTRSNGLVNMLKQIKSLSEYYIN